MKRRVAYLIPVLVLVGAGIYSAWGPLRSRAMNVPEVSGDSRIAAPGKVEPLSEEIDVAFAVDGRIAAIRVEEGDRIVQGQTLATLENADFRARVASAEAELDRRQAELAVILNGARPEELVQARLSVEAAQSVLVNARAEMERRRTLLQRGAVSEEEFSRSIREYEVANARYGSAVESSKLVSAGARREEREQANANVRIAAALLAEASASLHKTAIRSPLSAIVLRRHAEAGESVSAGASVLTIADDSIRRVRADVDEVDVARIAPGQMAFVRADAFGNAMFSGRVVRVGQALGRKNIHTDEPRERLDDKVLEVLIDLEDGHALPIGLRVDVFIETGARSK